MVDLKIKIELNKGRDGVALQKLARIATETEKFLEYVSEDVGLSSHEWVAKEFRNGSLKFVTEYIGTGEDDTTLFEKANRALSRTFDPKTKPSELNGIFSKRTYLQFAKIAHHITPDESIGFAVPNKSGRFVTKRFTRTRANSIEREMNRTIREYVGFQGAITALFKEGRCWLKNKLTEKRVIAIYKADQYNKIWRLFGDPDAIVNVEGWLDVRNGEEVLDIKRIEPVAEYREGDIKKFFGCDPSFTGDMTTEDYIDAMRGEVPH